MDSRYTTLNTLAAIVQEKLHPTQYACTPREMILHSSFDWEQILEHLHELVKEELVIISPAETLQFFITQAGLDMMMIRAHPLQAETAFVLREAVIAG